MKDNLIILSEVKELSLQTFVFATEVTALTTQCSFHYERIYILAFCFATLLNLT